MARNTNIKQTQKDSAAQGRISAALPRSGRKAPGTRAGTFRDWRGSNQPGKASIRIGKTLRDGC
jgi:hypothetical protein